MGTTKRAARTVSLMARSSPTASQVQAARAQLALDQKLGRASTPKVIKLAAGDTSKSTQADPPASGDASSDGPAEDAPDQGSSFRQGVTQSAANMQAPAQVLNHAAAAAAAATAAAASAFNPALNIASTAVTSSIQAAMQQSLQMVQASIAKGIKNDDVEISFPADSGFDTKATGPEGQHIIVQVKRAPVDRQSYIDKRVIGYVDSSGTWHDEPGQAIEPDEQLLVIKAFPSTESPA